MSDSPAIQTQTDKFVKLSDRIYDLLPADFPDVEVVLFHGWQMKGSDSKHAFWRTWKTRDSEDCWPETLLPDVLNEENHGTPYRPRVLSISYEARVDPGKDGNGTEISDEYLIIENLIQELILEANVGQTDGVPVFLLGHDLGGTLIKLFVLTVESRAFTQIDNGDKAKLSKFLDNMKSVFFYATPQTGSTALQNMADNLDPKNASQMLRLMKVLSSETSRINDEFQKFHSSKRCRFSTYGIHALHETNKGGFHVQVVEEASARADVDNFFPVDADHFTVCQPLDRSASELQLLCQTMKGVISTMRR